MNAEQRERALINRVYGNIGIESPRITREFVAEQLKKMKKDLIQNLVSVVIADGETQRRR